jgi:hypothetical protein
MKLKEKLAKEYIGYSGDIEYDWLLEAAFLAGFEKAKQLAIKCVFESYEPQVNISLMGEEEIDV